MSAAGTGGAAPIATGGAGGSTAAMGSGGMTGAAGMGSGGSSAAVMCGGQACMASPLAGFLMAGPCCSPSGKCSSKPNTATECKEPYENTSMCPDSSLMGFPVLGCCLDMATNKCGIWNSITNSGCTDPAANPLTMALKPTKNCDGTPVMAAGSGGTGSGGMGSGGTGSGGMGSGGTGSGGMGSGGTGSGGTGSGGTGSGGSGD